MKPPASKPSVWNGSAIRALALAYAGTHDLKAVSERLGHTTTRMVDEVYVELYPEATRDVADVVDVLLRSSRG